LCIWHKRGESIKQCKSLNKKIVHKIYISPGSNSPATSTLSGSTNKVSRTVPLYVTTLPSILLKHQDVMVFIVATKYVIE
jgi:hypothetical protein